MRIHLRIYLVYAAYIQRALRHKGRKQVKRFSVLLSEAQRFQIISKPFVRLMVYHQHESPPGTDLWHQD
jgi:hypothetical protein